MWTNANAWNTCKGFLLLNICFLQSLTETYNFDTSNTNTHFICHVSLVLPVCIILHWLNQLLQIWLNWVIYTLRTFGHLDSFCLTTELVLFLPSVCPPDKQMLNAEVCFSLLADRDFRSSACSYLRSLHFQCLQRTLMCHWKNKGSHRGHFCCNYKWEIV